MESSNLSFDSSHAFGRVTTSGSYGFFNCNCNTLGFNPWSPFVICPCGMKVHPQCVSLVASIPCTRKQVQRVTTMHRTAVQAFLSACFTELPEWVYISKCMSFLRELSDTVQICRTMRRLLSFFAGSIGFSNGVRCTQSSNALPSLYAR